MSNVLDPTPSPSPSQDGPEPVERSRPPGRHAVDSGASHTRLVLTSVFFVVALVGLGLAAYQIFGSDEPGEAQDSFVISFDVDSDDGLSGGGVTWEAVTGSFTASDGLARVNELNESGPRTIAVTDIGATNARFDVKAGQLDAEWGVVFRYVGPFNYWYVSAVPDFGVFNVVRVADGRADVVGRSDLVEMRDDMTITIDLQDAQIRVFAGDRVLYVGENDHALGATHIGILATAKSEDATWDELAGTTRPGGPARAILRRSVDDAGTVSTTTEATTEAPALPADEPFADPEVTGAVDPSTDEPAAL